MKLNEDDEAPVIVGVQFDEGLVAITYMEKREVTEAAVIQRTMMIDPDQVEEQIALAQDALRDLLDEGLLVLRKPPSKLSRVGALARAEKAREVDEDEWSEDDGRRN